MYLRKSRADMEAEARGEGETLSRHRKMLLETAKKMKLNITAEYKEIVSGDSIVARPQMQALLADVAESKYAGVLVVEIERLARGDTIDQGVVAHAFKSSSTKIITPIKVYDPENEFDEEYFEFSLFMSRREYKTINRRMQTGRLASVKEGNYIGTGVPYGYKKTSPEPKVHTLEIIEAEAEIVKLIYKLYLDGKGCRAIASELNRLQIAPQKNQYLEVSSIKKILKNPLYSGKVRWKNKASGETVYDGKHEAIISAPIFEAAQDKRINNPAAKLHQNDILHNYYSGILYCSNCEHQMRRRVTASGEYLLCRYRTCKGLVVGSTMRAVDEAVICAFRFRISELEKLQKYGGVAKIEVEVDKNKPLYAELERLQKQQNKLHDLLEQDVYDTGTFLKRSKAITVRMSKIKAELDKSVNIQAQKPVQFTPERSIFALRNIIDNFDTVGADEKNRLLKSAVRRIYYSKTEKLCYRKTDSDLCIEIDFL
jgi:DNA invertase Pin-like site-specific DNA recombinase